jgi:hypothetical protein
MPKVWLRNPETWNPLKTDEVLQFQNSPATESADNSRDDGAPMFKHPENTMAVNPKTLDFSEFSVGTAKSMS